MTRRSPVFLLAAVAALVIAPASASAAVLYDQTDNGGSTFISSNDYGASNVHTDQIADDFTVPAGQSWQISQVDAPGFVDGSPPTSVNVFIYANSGARPAAELFHAAAGSASRTAGGDYAIPLIGTPALSSGIYWVSVQQVGATYTTSDWFWQDRTVLSGSPAVYRNPGGGSKPTCTDWTPLPTCSGNPAELGVLFRLSGTATLSTGQRAAALKRCKKRAHKHHWSHKRLKKCKRNARLLPV